MSLPKITSEQIQEFDLSREQIKLLESQPGAIIDQFFIDRVWDELPLERLRSLDLSSLKARQDLRKLERSGTDIDLVNIDVALTCWMGGEVCPITL